MEKTFDQTTLDIMLDDAYEFVTRLMAAPEQEFTRKIVDFIKVYSKHHEETKGE